VTATSGTGGTRRRVPAAERREELIEAALHEFARGGLHGTTVADIARRVGVAQPYVFTLVPTKLELFLAVVDRGFARVEDTFRAAATGFHEGRASEQCTDRLDAMGRAYSEMLRRDRDGLLMQLQSYAACGEPAVREYVRGRYADLTALICELSGADDESINEFLRIGMALNVAAALGVEDLSPSCEWIRELQGDRRSGYDR